MSNSIIHWKSKRTKIQNSNEDETSIYSTRNKNTKIAWYLFYRFQFLFFHVSVVSWSCHLISYKTSKLIWKYTLGLKVDVELWHFLYLLSLIDGKSRKNKVNSWVGRKLAQITFYTAQRQSWFSSLCSLVFRYFLILCVILCYAYKHTYILCMYVCIPTYLRRKLFSFI